MTEITGAARWLTAARFTLLQGSMWAMNPVPRIDFDSSSSGQAPGWRRCRMPNSGKPPAGADGTPDFGCRQFEPRCEEPDPAWHTVNGSGFWGDVEGGRSSRVLVGVIVSPSPRPPVLIGVIV